MGLRGLRRDRAELLAAFALVADGRESISAGFRALAADDPALKRWLPRVADLDSGGDVIEWLQRWRLIDGDQGTWLRTQRASGQFAQALKTLSVGGRAGTPGLWLVQWFPLVLLIALTALPLLIWSLLSEISGNNSPGSFYNELGFRLPAVTEFVFVFPAWYQWVILICLYGVAFVSFWLIRKVRFFRVAMAAWAPSVIRSALICQLIQAAESQEGGYTSGNSLSERRWRDVWWLCWFRVSRRVGEAIQQPELPLLERLRYLGVLVERQGVVDWQASVDEAQARYVHERSKAHAWLQFIIVTAVFAPFVYIAFAPLMDLVNALSWYSSRQRGSVSGTLGYLLANFGWWSVGMLIAIVRYAPFLPTVLMPWGNFSVTTRRLAAALERGLSDRQDIADVLESVMLDAPLLDQVRLEQSIAAIRANPGEWIRALAEQRVLPDQIIRDLRAAETVGPEAVIAVCRQMAQRPSADLRSLLPWLVPYVFTLVTIFMFIMHFILPKFIKIYNELGMKPSWLLYRLSDGARWLDWDELTILQWPLVCFAALWLPTVIACVAHRRRPAGARLRSGQLLVAGLALGKSEQQLADGLLVRMHGASQQASLRTIAQRGDFSALARCCGWVVETPQALVHAVAVAEHRLRLRLEFLKAGVRVALPIVMALPVGLLGYTFFEFFYQVTWKLTQ